MSETRFITSLSSLRGVQRKFSLVLRKRADIIGMNITLLHCLQLSGLTTFQIFQSAGSSLNGVAVCHFPINILRTSQTEVVTFLSFSLHYTGNCSTCRNLQKLQLIPFKTEKIVFKFISYQQVIQFLQREISSFNIYNCNTVSLKTQSRLQIPKIILNLLMSRFWFWFVLFNDTWSQ